MTQVSVCRVGRKIACEPVENDAHNATETPPESFWLSKNAEFDWFNHNAILDRKESTKPNGANNRRFNPSSQRFSKSKAAIIGLPKTQKNNVCDMRRCKLTNVRLFPPKRLESIGKSTAHTNEPSSPKVSCIGRVRSKKSRRCRPENRPAKSEQKTKSDKKKGFCLIFLSLFRPDCRDGSVVKTEESSMSSSKKTSKSSENVLVRNEAVILAPGLGGMTRFVSSLRSYEMDEGDGARLSGDSEGRMRLRRCGSTLRN